MALSRTDGSDDTFTDAGEDGLFTGTANELLDVGAHGDAGFGDKLDTVLGHGGPRRRVNDLGVDGGLDGLEHVATGEIDGCGSVEVEVHVGLVGTDEGVDNGVDMSAGEVVSLEVVLLDFQAGFSGGNHVVDDAGGRYLTEAHDKELHQRGVHPRDEGLEPDSDRNKVEKQDECYKTHSNDNHCLHCHIV